MLTAGKRSSGDVVRTGERKVLAGETGFTLIELLIAVMIVGILVSIALPNYQEYLRKANRSAAKAVLLDIFSRQEQFATTNRAYYATPSANNLSGLGVVVPPDVLTHYQFEVFPCNAGTVPACTSFVGYRAVATPISTSQTIDGALEVNQFGLKTPVGKW